MMPTTPLTAVLAAAILAAPAAAQLPAPAPVHHAPPAFSDVAYANALEASGREGTTLVIDFWADWCGPCKMMDRDTWSDPMVVAWLEEQGVTAIQVNADRNPSLVNRHRAWKLPTVVVIKGGEAFDLTTGYVGPASMLRWLEGVQAGKTRTQILREAAGDRAGPDGRVDIRRQYQLAARLARDGDHQRATEEYLWLWHNMLDHMPTLIGVRTASMGAQMRDLALAYEPAMEAFATERDRVDAMLGSGGENAHLRADWVALSRVVGDLDAVFAWFDSLEGETRVQALRDYGYMFGDDMLERGRWADYGHTVRDVSRIVEVLAMTLNRPVPANLDPAKREELTSSYTEQALATVAESHAGLLAAGREDEAWTLAELATRRLRLDALGRRMTQAALDAGQPRQRHLGLLAERDAALGDRLRRALPGQTQP